MTGVLRGRGPRGLNPSSSSGESCNHRFLSGGARIVEKLSPIVTGYVVAATGSFNTAFVVAGALALVGRCRFEACGFYPIAEGRYPAHPHPLRTLGTFADISGESQLEWGGKYGRAASCIKRAVRTRGTAHLPSCNDANSA